MEQVIITISHQLIHLDLDFYFERQTHKCSKFVLIKNQMLRQVYLAVIIPAAHIGLSEVFPA